MTRFPNAFVIIIWAIFISWALTYVLPKGSYDRTYDTSTEKTIVTPNSYQRVEGKDLSLLDLLTAIPKGLIESADLIVLVLILGGCFFLIEGTGTFHALVQRMVFVFEGKEYWALIGVSTFFFGAGVTIAMQEEVVALTPLILLFGNRMGYQKLFVLLLAYGSTVVGSAFSPLNPFGVLIAQEKAELPLMSGMSFRWMILLIAFLIWLIFLMSNAKKYRIEKSINQAALQGLNRGHYLIMSAMLLTFGMVSFGLVQHNWGFNEMSGCFFALALFSGAVSKMGLNEITEKYVQGFKEMVFAATILGLSTSISILLNDGKVMDTLVFFLFDPLKDFSPSLSGVMMLFGHCLLHFPIPSYTGQALLTMPIITPLSDLIGLERQVAVLAYQYGAILMDMIVPTNGTLMAIITIANIPYSNWLKIALKPLLFFLSLAVVVIWLASTTGYH